MVMPTRFQLIWKTCCFK